MVSVLFAKITLYFSRFDFGLKEEKRDWDKGHHSAIEAICFNPLRMAGWSIRTQIGSLSILTPGRIPYRKCALPTQFTFQF